jgi:integrase
MEKKTNHTLRQRGITILVNDQSVNATEVAKAARHKSTKTQEIYTRPTAKSEAARISALL